MVGSGSLFHEIWDVLGCVWEYSGDVLGYVWEGLQKTSEESRTKNKKPIFKIAWEYFSHIGLPKTIILDLLPDKNIPKFETYFIRI